MTIKAPYLYLGFLFWLALLVILLKFGHLNITGLGITLFFLTFVLAPGFFLLRLFKIQPSNLAVKFLTIVALGFGFYFLVNFLAIILNLNLLQLGLLILGLVSILFAWAFWQDRQQILVINFALVKKQTLSDFLLWGAVIGGAIIAFLGIDAQSDKLLGDGWFHLAIMEKIVSGGGLSPYNLWVTKTSTLNPVYSFPIWHILVGMMAKILGIPIFTALRQVLLPLALLTLGVWLSFMTIVFKNRSLAIIGFLSFLLIFLKDNSFYYLVALPSPDSFNRLFLLPLILGLIGVLLFSENVPKIFYVLLISLLTVFLGLIHFTQFIYLFFILIVLLILGLIIYRQKEFLLKISYLVGTIAILILPYLLIFHGNFVSNFFQANALNFQGQLLNFQTFLGANVVYRLAILSLPIVALLAIKQKSLVLLLAIPATLLIIYFPFLAQGFFLKYFGEIFTSRALANIPNFIYFGLLLFLIILGVNYLISRTSRLIINLINILICLLILAIFIPTLKTFLTHMIEDYLFNEKFWLFSTGFWWLFGLISLGCLGIYLIFRRREISLSKSYHQLNFSLLAILIILVLSLPYHQGFKKVLAKNPNGSIFSNRLTTNASDIRLIGGQKTLDFLNSVPKRSVLMTSAPTMSQMVLIYSNNLVAEYPFGIKEFGESKLVFDENIDSATRLATIKKLNPDYIIVQKTSQQEFFKQNQAQFKLVFANIYPYNLEEKGVVKSKTATINVYEYLE